MKTSTKAILALISLTAGVWIVRHQASEYAYTEEQNRIDHLHKMKDMETDLKFGERHVVGGRID